jgi:hypothetical protein
MTSEQVFVLVIVIITVMVIAVMQYSKNRQRIKRMVMERLNMSLEAGDQNPDEPEKAFVDREPVADRKLGADSEPEALTQEQQSKAELDRLQKLIENRKQFARDNDISYHLWDFYKNHFRLDSSGLLDRFFQQGEWYEVNILKASTTNGLNKFEFELKGVNYKFVDDEENQGWADNTKYFSLFLYDDSGRCLIEIPIKLKVDKWGRKYSIWSDGPKAFIPGDWVKDFISVTLKHQHIRNQEIREQKHKERLWEIEELKNRFGISD